jgi:leucyl-tRNA synthetase
MEKYFLKSNPEIKVKVGPPEAMSKSKKNTIDPQNIIDNYGADAVRFFILADSPPERDVQWSDEGMISAHKFIQKFWSLNEEILKITKLETKFYDEELEIFTNQIHTQSKSSNKKLSL